MVDAILSIVDLLLNSTVIATAIPFFALGLCWRNLPTILEKVSDTMRLHGLEKLWGFHLNQRGKELPQSEPETPQSEPETPQSEPETQFFSDKLRKQFDDEKQRYTESVENTFVNAMPFDMWIPFKGFQDEKVHLRSRVKHGLHYRYDDEIHGKLYDIEIRGYRVFFNDTDIFELLKLVEEKIKLGFNPIILLPQCMIERLNEDDILHVLLLKRVCRPHFDKHTRELLSIYGHNRKVSRLWITDNCEL